MANLKAGSTIGGEAVLTAGNISSYNLNFLNGNVGIGTTSPNKTLEVAGNIRATKTSVDGGDIALGLNVGGSADHPVLDIYDKDGNDGVRITANGNSWLSAKGGNVGIGTTNPIGKLSIEGSTASDYKTHIVFNNTGGSKDYAIGAGVHGLTNEGFGITDRNTNDPLLYINSDGNVGIGTSSPGNFSGLNFNTTTLDVAGMIQIKSTTGGVATLQIGGDTYRKASIFTPISTSDPYMAFAVSTSGTSSSANEAVRITSAGNVGIGTTTPEGKLEIEHTGSWDNPSIHLKGQYPTMKFNDTNAEDDWYIHVNSNNFYLLVDRGASGSDDPIGTTDNVWETPHPLQLEGGTNKGYLFANEIITAGNVGNFAQTSAFNGGTVTSAITIQNTNPIFTLKDTNGGDANSQSGYINFTDNNNTSRGWVGFGSTGDKIISIKNNIGGINLITDTGATVQANSSRVFTDAYHPNADQWTTSRTLTLGGDLSGSVSINGGSNATLTATVTDGSHNHSAGNITSGTLDSARIPAATSTNLGGVKVSYNAASQTLSITTT